MTDRALRHMVVTQLPGIDGTGITVAEKAQLVNDVFAVTTTTDVLAALRFDPEHPLYGAVRSDIEPGAAVKSANRAAIQLAADDARDAGGTLVLKGSYWIDDTVTFQCHVDGAGGEILVSDPTINPAVAVGIPGVHTATRRIDLPRVRQMGRSAPGWSGSSDVGVKISNVNQCKIYIPFVRDFREAVQLYSESGGHAYNEYSIGILINGLYNLNFKTGTGGWVNENLFIGGRFGHDSSEGTNISGVRHIRIPVAESGHPFNNNYFLKPSVEGNTPEYHVEAGGMYNTITQGRWEASPPKVLWGAEAYGWVIDGGYSAHTIQFTGTALNTRVVSRASQNWYAGAGAGGVFRMANRSGAAYPVITVMQTGDTFWSKNPETDYTVAIGPMYTRFKQETDTHPRIELQATTGDIYMGDGATAPGRVMRLASSGGTILDTGPLYVGGPVEPSVISPNTPNIQAGSADPEGAVTAPAGSLYMRSNGTIYRKSSGTGDAGWVAMS